MIGHWLAAGWRSLAASPLFSLITIASLSVGCCGALLAGANILQHLSFERWIPHADRILLERQTFGMGSQLGDEARLFKFPGDRVNMGLAGAIEGRIDGMIAQTRVTPCNFVKWPDAVPPTPGVLPFPPPLYQGRCVDPDFFKVFELEFIEGGAAGALAAPDSIVISEKVARKYFGAGPVLGKTFETTRAGMVVHVAGVIRDAPAATDLKLDALLPMAFRQRQLPSGGSDPNGLNVTGTGQHYIRMADDADADQFMAGARRRMQAVFDDRLFPGGPPRGSDRVAEQVSLVPLLDIHLAGEERTGMQSSGDVSMLLTLGTAAAALLGVSAFNYVTLSLARSLRRRREVGIRKVLGAGQGDLVRHYLAESALVTAISLAIGFVLAQLLHPWFARAIGQPETLFEIFDPAFVAGVLVVFALLALAVGAYPAFYLANVRPRAGLEDGGSGAPTGMGRFVSGGLLGLQIAAATVLLGVALTMAVQADYVAKRPLGFDYKGMYTSMMQPCPAASMRPTGQRPTRADYDASNLASEQCTRRFLELLRQTPGIGRVTSSSIYSLVNDSILTYGFGRAPEGEERGKAAHYTVGFDYLQTMGAKLLAGRFFDANSQYDRALDAAPRSEKTGWPDITRTPAIVTRALLSRIGADTPEKALGQVIYMQGEATYGMEIVGVVEDWHQRSLKYNVHPIIFSPSEKGGRPTFEVTAEDPDALVQGLRTRWNELVGAPAQSVLMATPVERAFAAFYDYDRKLMGATITFSSVAMIVAAVGVFGLSAFEMRRRVREIGVRKALGATPWRVAALAIGRAVVFAAIASVLAWPVAWWIAETWLSSYVYRTALGPALLPLASLAVVAAVAFAVTFNAIRAAAIRPSTALRNS